MAGKENKNTNLSLWITPEDMTLVYELLHDVKITYAKLSPEDKRRGAAKSVIASCNRIMKKIEYKLLGEVKEEKGENA